MTSKHFENDKRIQEMAQLIEKLNLLDGKELSYVDGSVSALVFSKQLRKNDTTKNKDAS